MDAIAHRGLSQQSDGGQEEMIDGKSKTVTTDDNCIAMKLQKLQRLAGIIKEILPSMPRA